jgi:hypothetical protein
MELTTQNNAKEHKNMRNITVCIVAVLTILIACSNCSVHWHVPMKRDTGVHQSAFLKVSEAAVEYGKRQVVTATWAELPGPLKRRKKNITLATRPLQYHR